MRRTPYSLESGGHGSALWKSTDGGDTWDELSDNAGFPGFGKGDDAPPLGIIGITVSPSNPENLYACVEAEEGGVFRSRDGGETWARVNSERKLRQRAWYYTRLYADPADEEVVYVLNVRFWRSQDGGKTYESISVPHGDNHDLWIDPADPQRMIQANDGGANVSFDGGATWSTQSNQPTSQMYRVSVDDDFPYRLLGGQQDNSAVRIRSRSFSGSSIGEADWESTAGGESGHVVAKPGAPDVVYGGSYGGYLTRLNHATGERRSVDVWPDNPMGWGAAELKVRFNWNFPLFFSPHDPDRLYAAGNVLFVTEDEGHSWTALGGDLTRDEKSMMGSSGGPITKDNTSVEYYGTIFAACESPAQAGVLWCGSDDGLVHVSQDAGASWSNVTPDWPEWLMVNCIDPHPTNPAVAYVAGTRYKLDDFEPYLYKTADYGASWTRIDAGIARDHFTRAVRVDPGGPRAPLRRHRARRVRLVRRRRLVELAAARSAGRAHHRHGREGREPRGGDAGPGLLDPRPPRGRPRRRGRGAERPRAARSAPGRAPGRRRAAGSAGAARRGATPRAARSCGTGWTRSSVRASSSSCASRTRTATSSGASSASRPRARTPSPGRATRGTTPAC